jgi:ADP-ribosylglycohydrolase
MALSVVEVLRQYGEIDQDQLALSFARHYDKTRGYGAAMHGLLPRLGAGEPWCRAASSLFGGKGSYGNGAAMRVAPVGAYFADDLDAVVENARRAAEVTHMHPEAVAGAIAVAVAAAWAWRVRDSAPLPNGPDFIDLVLPSVPPSEVRRGIRQVRDFSDDMTVDEVVTIAGNGEDVTAQDTVPFVLWCAGQHLDYFEEALWLTVSGLGDRDTTCAMVGGIVAMRTGLEDIPTEWVQSREALPAWILSGEGE